MEKDELKVSLQPQVDRSEEAPYIDPGPTDRIVATVASPMIAFNGLLRARNLGAIIGLSLVVGIVTLFASFLLISQTEVYAEQISEQTEKTLERFRESGQFSTDQMAEIERSMGGNSNQGPVMVIVGFILMVPILTLIISLAVLVVSKILEKSSESYVRFTHALTVSSMAIVPFGLLSLLMGLIQFLFEVNVTSFGLSGFVGQENMALYTMATLFTIPPLAYVASLAFGTRSLARSGVVGPFIILLILALVAYGVLGFLQDFALSMAG